MGAPGVLGPRRRRAPDALAAVLAGPRPARRQPVRATDARLPRRRDPPAHPGLRHHAAEARDLVRSRRCIAALAGILYVPQVGIINPRVLGPDLSIEIAVWVAIGGLGRLGGAVIGAVLVNALKFWRAPRCRRRGPSSCRASSLVVLVLPNGLLDLAPCAKPPGLRRGSGDERPRGRGAHRRFGALPGARRPVARGRSRRGARGDRPERRRQDHAPRRDLGHHRPKSGRVMLGDIST